MLISFVHSESGRSAGVVSTASEMTSYGPATPLDDISPHAGPRAKASAIYAPSADSREASYRSFARTMVISGKKSSKQFDGAKQLKSMKAGRTDHSRGPSIRGADEDD